MSEILLSIYIILVSTDPAFEILGVFSERLECSRVSESVTSLSDVASTDTESSDTATESVD